MKRCIVVVPTYNEAENLAQLVPEVLAQGPSLEVLGVDDASPDGTGELADKNSLGSWKLTWWRTVATPAKGNSCAP